MSAHNGRRFLTLTAAALATPALPRLAAADVWPKDKPIRAVVPFTAGSTIDILGRIVIDPVSRQIGQTIIIENHGGAGGLSQFVLRCVGGLRRGRLLWQRAERAAGGAIQGLQGPQGLRRQGPGRQLDLWLRRRRQRHALGCGALPHQRRHQVPFRGGPEQLTEVMTGRVDFCLIGISSSLPFIRNGQLHALAVSSAKRSPALPDTPTTLEAGYKDSDFNYWNGMLMPAKTPRPIVDRLHAEVTKALALPEVQAKLNTQGVEPAPMSPTEMDAMIKREIDLNIRIAKAAGLKFN
jgi:tripartite-type tricarboxylate transporter receptor subunit TctC